MIVANVIGGLGNQMFQYATARALSLRRSAPLVLDASQFGTYTLHQGFELPKVFRIDAPLATTAEVRSLLGLAAYPWARRVMSGLPWMPLGRKRWVAEPHFQHWPGLDEVPADCYLTGYWQSERYFSDQSEQVRKDFRFCQGMDPENERIAAMMSSVPGVSLHVRRGDYASNPRTAATHGLCSPDYYSQALEFIQARVPGIHVFVFSDDLGWVQKNLSLKGCAHTFVQHNRGASSWRDMQLMSLCRHHIIANSSFSWWGAWLNPHSDKLVTAPQRWFAIPVDTSDLIPPTWTRV